MSVHIQNMSHRSAVGFDSVRSLFAKKLIDAFLHQNPVSLWVIFIILPKARSEVDMVSSTVKLSLLKGQKVSGGTKGWDNSIQTPVVLLYKHLACYWTANTHCYLFVFC